MTSKKNFFNVFVMVAALTSITAAGLSVYRILTAREVLMNSAIIEGLPREQVIIRALVNRQDEEQARIQRLEKALSEIQPALELLERSLKEVSRLETGDVSRLPQGTLAIAQLERLHSQINAVDTRLSKIESSIMQNPETALTLPLLKKDVELLKNEFPKHLDRISEQYKNFNTLLIAVLAALIGLGGVLLTMLLKKKTD
jgi:hypothetical protein